MSWPKLHMQRNCFYFYLIGTVSYLSARRDLAILSKEEQKKINEVYTILKDLTQNRYKRYWELKKEKNE